MAHSASGAGIRGSAKGARRPTLLAIDDDEGILDALQLLLAEDYEFFVADTGRRGLEIFLAQRVDVVLLDLRLPGMHGFEVLKRLRASDPRATVIVVSAVTDLRDAVESMRLGASDYVTKPWDDDELIAVIARAYREKRVTDGVLLLSEDPAVLVPLQLALESRVRVVTTSPGRALESGFPARVVVLDVQAGNISPALIAALLDRFHLAAWVLVAKDAQVLAESGLPPIMAAVVAIRPYRHDHLVRRISDLLELSTRAEVDSRPTADAVSAAFDLMAHQYARRLTVQDVARAVGLSDDRFAHLFREVAGVPVRDYLLRLRIAVARRLLGDTNHKLEDIARQVGFADVSSFSRAFTTVVGSRPGAFRRQRHTRS